MICSRPSQHSPNDAGFTLIEMLIAIFIFALISLGSMMALTSTLQGREQINDHLDKISEIETARTLMKSDFSNIILRPNRDAYGGSEIYVLSGGDESLITFTRVGRLNPGGVEPRSDLQRVSYIVEDGNLIRRSLAQTNPVPQTATIDRVMIRGLSDARFEFTVDAQSRPYFNISLDDLNSPDFKPALERLTLTTIFENGSELVQHFEVGL